MIKKFINLLLCAAVLLTHISAAAAAGADDAPLSVIYFTKMPLQSSFSDMSRLTDGIYDANSPVVVQMSSSAQFDETYMIEGFFGGNTVAVSSVEVGCLTRQVAEQAITRARLDYYNPGSDSWESAVDGYELTWNGGKSVITLPETINTIAVRFYIQDANRRWNNFRIEELAMVGTVTGAVENISGSAAVTADYDFQSGSAQLINDGNFFTEVVGAGGVIPSPEQPRTVELNFGEDVYHIDKMIIGERYGRNAGITNASLYRKIYGTWEKIADIVLQKEGVYSSDNYSISEFELNTEASALRLCITAANTTWNNFRIGEIMLTGEKSEGGKDMTENVNAAYPENKELPYIITLSSEYAFVPKALCFTSEKVSEVEIGTETDGVYTPIVTSQTVFSGGETTVIIPGNILTDSLQLRVISAESEDYSVGEIKLFAQDPVADILPMISAFENSKKYADYQSAVDAAASVAHQRTREKITDMIENAADKLRSKQNLTAEYNLYDNKLTFGGYLFAAASENYEADISCEGTAVTEYVSVDENGSISAVIDCAALANGNYTVSVRGYNVSADFIKRALNTESIVKTFSIDGAGANISGTNINITLPAYGSLKNRVAVFSLSDGAKMYLGENEVVSGITQIDYSTPVTVKVLAEDRVSNTVYTVHAAVAPSPSGGASSGSSSGSSSGKGMTAPVIYAPVQNDENRKDEISFTDVPKSHWAYDYIVSLAEKGAVSGYNDGSFCPGKNVLREEFVKILVDALGIGVSGEEANFADARGHWSSKYIAAASANGLVSGMDRDNFGIGQNLKREDLAVILFKCLPADKQAEDISDVPLFDDDADIADYARTAVYSLRKAGIIDGDNNMFRPKDSATRAEAAKIIYCLTEGVR